jgi:hypothetical protein
LFNKEVQPLVFQQNRNEITKCIKESILNAVRDSIPVDKLLRAYLDETTDLLKEEKVKEEIKPEEKEKETKKNLSFSDNDMAITIDNEHETIHAPKDEETLEKKLVERHEARKALEQEEEEDKIKFVEDTVPIVLETVSLDSIEPPIQIDIEELK